MATLIITGERLSIINVIRLIINPSRDAAMQLRPGVRLTPRHHR